MIVCDTDYGQANGIYVDMNKQHDDNLLCLRKPGAILMLDRASTKRFCR